MSSNSTATAATSAVSRRAWLALAVVLVAECMDLLDSTIVNVAAPAIHRQLGTSSTALQWIVGGYSFALAVGLITGGRLGDLVGRRRMFLLGVAGFTIASALCGVAPSTPALIGFRLVQGLAAAVMLPQGFGVIREVFPAEQLGKAFMTFGPVLSGGAVIGPVLGGGLIALDPFGTGWRSVFFVNVPLGVSALLAGARLLPPTAPTQRGQLDLAGTAVSGVAAFALVYPLIQGRQLGWPAWSYLMMAGSVVLFAGFWAQQRRRERKGAEPLVVTSVLSHRGYTAGLLGMTLFFGGMGGTLLVLSVYLQGGEHFTAVRTGVAFIPMAVGMGIGGALSGAWLGPRFGRRVIMAGAAVTAMGWLLVVLLALRGNSQTSVLELLPGLLVAGLGGGLVVAPLFDIVLAAVTDRETGSASGLLNAVQQLAGAVGVAVYGRVFFAAIGRVGARSAAERTLLVQLAGMVAMGGIAAALPRRARTEPAPAPSEAHPPALEAATTL